MKRLNLSDLLAGLGIGLLLLLVAAGFARVGIALFGSLEAWNTALADAAPYLRVWRAALYATLICVWLKLCRHHRNSPEDLARIRNIGLRGLGACAVIEFIHSGTA